MVSTDFSALWRPTRDALGGHRARIHGRTIVLWWLLGFAVAALWAPAGLSNGDAAVYAQQIQQKNFAERPVHLGYYLWGATLTGFQSSFSDRALHRVGAAFGAGILVLLAVFSVYLTGRTALGWVAVLAGLGHWTLAQNLVWAEVYGPQTFFLLLAVLLLWRDLPAWAGLALASSVLISPSSLLAVPALCFLQPRLRSVAILGAVGGAVTLGAIAPVWTDYFHGSRGLLGASGASLGIGTVILKEGVEVVLGLFAFLPFAALALWSLRRRRELRPFVPFLGLLWLPAFLFGERFLDVPVQLTLWALLVPVAMVGVDELIHGLEAARESGRGAWIHAAVLGLGVWALIPALAVAGRRMDRIAEAPSVLPWLLGAAGALAAASAVVSLGSPRARAATAVGAVVLVNLFFVNALVRGENRQIDGYRERVLEIHEIARPGYRVVASWDRGILFEHYLWRRSYTEAWILPAKLEGRWGDEEQSAAEARFREAVEQGREVWLLGSYPDPEERLRASGYEVEEIWEDVLRARPAKIQEEEHG